MDRFFATVDPNRGKAYIEKDFQHFKVKRVRENDLVEVIDEETFKPYLGRVLKMEKRRAVVEILEEISPNVPKVFIRLYQCVPVKVSTFDWIVEKATEIGVSEIVPVISKRSYQKISVVKDKIPRWERVAVETLKQCGRHIPPKILPPLKIELVEPREGFLNLFPFERNGDNNLFEVLEKVPSPKGVNLIVGPEGGFSAEEASMLIDKGFNPVSLGNFILKSETAAAVAAGIVYNRYLSKRK